MNTENTENNAVNLNNFKKSELIEQIEKQDKLIEALKKELEKKQKKIEKTMEERGHASITYGEHLPIIKPHGEIGKHIAESQKKMKALVELGKNPTQKSAPVLALKLGFKSLNSAQKAIFLNNTGMELTDGDLEPTKLTATAKFSA